MRQAIAEPLSQAARAGQGSLPRGKRHRAAERTATIPAAPERIFEFESFIDTLPFLEPSMRARMKLAGGEIFDNLVRHAGPLESDAVIVRATRHRDGSYLAFYFKSSAFAPFAACSECGRVGPDAALELDFPTSVDESLPFFDPIIGRWRGIGLRMCRYLSRSLVLRAGSRLDRIYIAF